MAILKRKRQPDPPLQQDSRFLSLPTEIRDQVIGEACKDLEKLANIYLPCRGVKPSAHPLLHTCRQLRSEFSEAWAKDGLTAAETARTIVCHTRNFDIGEILWSELKEWLAALPKLANGGERQFVLQAHLDHTFELSMFMCKWWAYDRASHVQLSIEVQLDSMASEASYLRTFLQHYRRILKSEVLIALDDAIVRFEAKEAGKKKASTGSGCEGAEEDDNGLRRCVRPVIERRLGPQAPGRLWRRAV